MRPLARSPRPEALAETDDLADPIPEMADRWKADPVRAGARGLQGVKAQVEKSASGTSRTLHPGPC